MGILTVVLGATACVAAVITDVAWRRVPNWITLPLFLLAPAAVWVQYGFLSALISIAIVAAFIAVGIAVHGAGLLGGGDVKLIAGVAALCGLPQCINFALYTSLAGGVLALLFALSRRELKPLLGGLHRRVGLSLATGRLATETMQGGNVRMPYAIAIGAGFALTSTAAAVPFLRIFH